MSRELNRDSRRRLTSLSDRAKASKEAWQDDVAARDEAIWEAMEEEGASYPVLRRATGLSHMQLERIIRKKAEEHQTVHMD